jgi:hypothetical protein
MGAEEHKTEARSGKEFLVCVSLLPAIREKFASSFDLLEIPEVLRIDECEGRHGSVFFREYVGDKYDHRWSEQPGERAGGSALGIELSLEMPRLIADFRKIDIGWILGHPVGKRIDEASFDLEDWIRSLQDRKSTANGLGISDDDVARAGELVGGGFESAERIFFNGDFYPRNLIKLAQKVVVIDWQYWPGARVCFIDYLPNAIAFAYIHMWGNRRWQTEFLRHVHNLLPATSGDLRKAILIRAFEQAMFWKGDLRLASPQVGIFRAALRNDIAT